MTQSIILSTWPLYVVSLSAQPDFLMGFKAHKAEVAKSS
jgi:hypothetical protein